MLALNTVHYADFDYAARDSAIKAVRLAKTIERRGDNAEYKVGSVLFGIDDHGRTFFVPTVNTTPMLITQKLGRDVKIGTSHSTEHGEMVGLRSAPKFIKASLAVSRNTCPTCLSCVSEFNGFSPENGVVERIYGDSRSLALRDIMSKLSVSKHRIAKPMLEEIADKGKIPYYYINPDRKRIKHRYGPADFEYVPRVESPILAARQDGVSHINEFQLDVLLGNAMELAKTGPLPDDTEAAILIAKNANGTFYTIGATAAMPPGFVFGRDQSHLGYHDTHDKRSYKYVVHPISRVLIAAAKLGLTCENGALVTTYTPDSGMLINAIGAGVPNIVTPRSHAHTSTNPDFAALTQLTEAGIIRHSALTPVLAHLTPHSPGLIFPQSDSGMMGQDGVPSLG